MANLDYDSPILFKGPVSSVGPLEYHFEDLLPGFPLQYTGARVWSGPEMSQKQNEWTTLLSAEDNGHIIKALRAFQSEIGYLLTCIHR